MALSSTHQRIARCGIADALGERQWKAFKRFVRRHFLRTFLDLFDPADHVLRCCGPLDGGCCPQRFVVDLAGPQRVDFRLAGLHLDHEYDVRHICEAWRRAMPANPRRWDDGVNGLRLAHLFFGVQPLGAWPARVRLRCGNNRYYGHWRPGSRPLLPHHRRRALQPRARAHGPRRRAGGVRAWGTVGA